MTTHIDEEVLERVMRITGAKTKTAAAEIALKEMARQHRMKELFSSGLGLTAEKLQASFDPASLPEESAVVPHAAEAPVRYGTAAPAGR